MLFKLKPYIFPEDGEEVWRNEKKSERYSDVGYSFQDVYFTDMDVAKYIKQHTHWWDRLDYHFVADCTQEAFLILSGHIYAPLEKRWYFGKRYTTHWKPTRKAP